MSAERGVRSAERTADNNGLPVELKILELFNLNALVVLGPSDVERLTGISKGSVSAKLKALADARYLKAVGAGKYQLGPKVMEMAMSYVGLVAGKIDEARALLDVNLAEVRGAIQLLAASAQAVGGKG